MNRIKEVLKKQGRTQSWLAVQIDRSYVVTTNYCNNKTKLSPFMLNKIASILSVDKKELLFERSRVLTSNYAQKNQGLQQHFDLDVTI
jgi:putative transcriptional regulator